MATHKNCRDPKDNSRNKDRLDYYTWLAKLAEKGKIFCIFFADAYAGMKYPRIIFCSY
jgi:hypothetical protein